MEECQKIGICDQPRRSVSVATVLRFMQVHHIAIKSKGQKKSILTIYLFHTNKPGTLLVPNDANVVVQKQKEKTASSKIFFGAPMVLTHAAPLHQS